MSASDISCPRNSSDTTGSSLIQLDSYTKGGNNVICEATGCKKKAVFFIHAKAGQQYIPLNLCEVHKDICNQ
jgi:hypothetical protein